MQPVLRMEVPCFSVAVQMGKVRRGKTFPDVNPCVLWILLQFPESPVTNSYRHGGFKQWKWVLSQLCEPDF